MAGPCISDGNCTDFYMDGDNLRVDVKVSSQADNALICDTVGSPQGLYVPKNRSRVVEGTANTVVSGRGGVSVNSFGSVHIDVMDFYNDLGSAFNNTPVEITNTTTTTYKNTTTRDEIVTFDFVMGQTEYNLRSGWNFVLGQKVGWFSSGVGDPSFDSVSALRVNTGLNTGRSALNQALQPTVTTVVTPSSGTATASNTVTASVEPFGVTFPPYVQTQRVTLVPGEQLNCQYRLWGMYEAVGLSDSSVNQTCDILFGMKCRIQAWTKG